MAEIDTTTIEVPNGKVAISLGGGTVACEIQKGETKFQEKAIALPNHRDIFKKIGPKEKIQQGDIIVIQYSDGSGYAEVVKDVSYDADGKLLSLKSVVPKGDQRERKHLLSKSKFDQNNGTFNYDGIWDASHDAMSFSIIRSKSESSRNNNNGNLQTEFDTKLRTANTQFDELFGRVKTQTETAASQRPDKKYGFFSGLLVTPQVKDKANSDWKNGGERTFNSWNNLQTELANYKKQFEKDIREAQTPEQKTKVVEGLVNFVNKVKRDRFHN